MKISQRETAIDCYHSKVMPKLASSQNERVMAVIKPGKDYSLTELTKLVPSVDKSSMSRVINGLRAAGRLVTAPERKCSVTRIRIIPSRIPSKQADLFL
jgi:hypothetical protein